MATKSNLRPAAIRLPALTRSAETQNPPELLSDRSFGDIRWLLAPAASVERICPRMARTTHTVAERFCTL